MYINQRLCTEPTPCPAGTYSDKGWVNCLPCKAGYRCKQQSTSDSPEDGKLKV